MELYKSLLWIVYKPIQMLRLHHRPCRREIEVIEPKQKLLVRIPNGGVSCHLLAHKNTVYPRLGTHRNDSTWPRDQRLDHK